MNSNQPKRLNIGRYLVALNIQKPRKIKNTDRHHNAAISRGLLCVLFARKWERSDRAKSAQSKMSAALLC
ncbi:hypothetical protein KUV95_17105 [Microbulbifer agarilyticus]|uniref:hypothetical protein n=1 Tax=Microbulbifer agarilyticus TaxID=260552 RepID=UPI001C96E907|nr:hypothetical protein [Microbulbifer agarilyticus]MBY6213269.1 hypothetical protein [Microbulbifer agarilyticus]